MGVPHSVGNGVVLYIANYTKHVSLGLQKGAKIKDTNGLLEGAGKVLRHVTIVKGTPLSGKPLVALIRKAVALDGG